MKLPELESILESVIKAAPAVLTILIGYLIIRFIFSRVIRLVADKTKLTPQELSPLSKILHGALLGVTIILILDALGFPLGGLWAVLSTILAMVAIGFVAVWSVLSNISCTAIILLFRPFSIGDDVEFVGEPVKGRVIDLNFLYTTLHCEDGAVIQIPNNLFFQKSLKRVRGQSSISLAQQLGNSQPATH